MVGEEHGPELMVGTPGDLQLISDRQCCPDVLSLPRFLWSRARAWDLALRFFGPRWRRHGVGLCRWCGFYADAGPTPPRQTSTVAEVLLVGRVRRRGEFCWGQHQTLHRVWLPSTCGRPEQPEIATHDQPAVAVGGFDWVDGEGNTEAVSLCRYCARDWRYGTVFDSVELARLLGAPVHWLP